MWLFDDILNRPNNSGSTANPSGQGSGGNPSDPLGANLTPNHAPAFVIEKSEPQSIFGNHDVAPVTPEVTITPANPMEVSLPTISPIEGTPEWVHVWEVVPSPSLETHTTEVNPTPIIPSEATEGTINTTPSSNTNDSFSLFGSLSDDTNTIQVPVSESSDIQETMVPEVLEAIISPSPLHPQEFIEKSITEIDAMIASIQEARTRKIQEAESYGQEKERQAQLEHTAYEDATVMDNEIAHAERMKQLLEKELSESNTPETIESTTVPEVNDPTESLMPKPILSAWNPETEASNDPIFVAPESTHPINTSGEELLSQGGIEKLAA